MCLFMGSVSLNACIRAYICLCVHVCIREEHYKDMLRVINSTKLVCHGILYQIKESVKNRYHLGHR